jgi:flavin reductase (DIM6/NTAB) family NADH-FMN oxidoreductase RutF
MKPSNWSAFREHCARPERICWAVAEHDGKRSICPIGWKMNTSISPPMIAISVGPGRFTHGLIVKSKEFVLAWPGEDLAEATMFCGTKSARNVDKFAAMKLTPLPAKQVKCPLIGECIANLECRLAGQMTTGDHTIFVGEILQVWINEKPRRLLCSIDQSSGYDFLIEQGMYRFGVVKA